MKRRDLFKMLGTLAAAPFVAPLVALCKPKPVYDQAFYTDWSDNPIAAANGHVKLTAVDDSDYFPGNPTYNDPRYFFIHSVEPSPAEKAMGVIEKRIYGSSL